MVRKNMKYKSKVLGANSICSKVHKNMSLAERMKQFGLDPNSSVVIRGNFFNDDISPSVETLLCKYERTFRWFHGCSEEQIFGSLSQKGRFVTQGVCIRFLTQVELSTIGKNDEISFAALKGVEPTGLKEQSLEEIWQTLLEYLPTPTRALLEKHGRLKSFSNHQAHIAMSLPNLLAMAHRKVDKIEEAFLKVFDLQVKVIIINSKVIEPRPLIPPATNRQSLEEIWRTLVEYLPLNIKSLFLKDGRLAFLGNHYAYITISLTPILLIFQNEITVIEETFFRAFNLRVKVVIIYEREVCDPPSTGSTNTNKPSIEAKKLIYDTSVDYAWEGHAFRSEQEMRVAKALDRRGVFFFPNAGCRINEGETRKTREVDFLVVINGYLGILECDSRKYHKSAADDHERDRTFQKQGIRFIQRYSYERCLDADKVVDEFIALMKAHFQISE